MYSTQRPLARRKSQAINIDLLRIIGPSVLIVSMPLGTQFSLSLELMKLPAFRTALTDTADSIISLMRDLRRSGSDILVEEDLAAIFGRAKIVPSVERHFKDVVKVASFVPLHPGSEIILDAGPGATVRRALKHNHYMATVIQLSFLGWMHETTSLASMLVGNMNQRFQMGIEGATPDPDYEGILATLQACISQTSQYPWEMLVQLVESKFEKSSLWLRIPRSPLRRLPPNILLAAMDYLYLVQSLPEDRFMMIDNQRGLIPIVLWAHCILGLRVHVQDLPDGDVFFGVGGNPQVIIKWSKEWEVFEAEQLSHPTACLLDREMNVILTTSPEENEAIQIEGEERHRLEGYGTTFLHRLFNKTSVVPDNLTVFSEAAYLAVAFAIAISRVLRRVPYSDAEYTTVPPQCCGNTEIWQIQESSLVLFNGIPLEWDAIENYTEEITTENGSWRIPPAIHSYLKNTKSRKHLKNYQPDMRPVLDGLILDIKRIASWILVFAQVVEVKTCSQLPLIWNPEWILCTDIMGWDGHKPIDIPSNIWFSGIIRMLAGQNSGKFLVGNGSRLFLICERGWSVYPNNIGDNDPGTVNCESLSIKRGVPTSTRTQERRYQISDAPRIRPLAPPKGPNPSPWIIEESGSYVPRCVTPVVKRTEYYSSRSKEFWLSVRYDIRETWPEEVKEYSLYASHRQFHEALWGVVKSEPCTHPKDTLNSEELDLGVVTVKGFDWTADEFSLKKHHRICICLVKGDPGARWLVIGGIVRDTDNAENVPKGLTRRVMLRCNNCCVSCAVQSASSMEGRWLVIL